MKSRLRFCPHCNRNVRFDHWYWMPDPRYLAGGKWRCRQAKKEAGKRSRDRRKLDPVRHDRHLRYHRRYAKKHLTRGRYKAYCSVDKQRGFETISWISARVFMGQPCWYCKVNPAEGLDRKNSDKGHSPRNVVPCCQQCNIILGDLPYRAKLLFRGALKKARDMGFLGKWVIPTKRRHKCPCTKQH